MLDDRSVSHSSMIADDQVFGVGEDLSILRYLEDGLGKITDIFEEYLELSSKYLPGKS